MEHPRRCINDALKQAKEPGNQLVIGTTTRVVPAKKFECREKAMKLMWPIQQDVHARYDSDIA